MARLYKCGIVIILIGLSLSLKTPKRDVSHGKIAILESEIEMLEWAIENNPEHSIGYLLPILNSKVSQVEELKKE